MSVTQDYKILTISDRSVIRLALMMRKNQLESMLEDLKTMVDGSNGYDRLRTQLLGELQQVKAVLPKVSL